MRASRGLLCAGVAVFMAAAMVRGQERVVVRCVDTAGKPVKGAEVHVFQHVKDPDRARHRQFGPFTTDAKGSARGPVALTYDGGKFDHWIYARVPGVLVGGLRAFRNPVGGIAKLAPLEVVMVGSRTVRGVVRVPEGCDPRAVRVHVLSAYVRKRALAGRQDRDVALPRYHGFPGLDTVLPRIFETTADAEGRFALRDVPRDVRLYLAADAKGLGQAQYCNARMRPSHPEYPEVADPVVMELQRQAVLAGKVIGPRGAALHGVRVAARIWQGDHLPVQLTFEAVTDERGAFRIEGLPGATFSLSTQKKAAGWVFRPQQLEIGPGKVRDDLELAVERGIAVSGRVVDAATGEGVGGASVLAITSQNRGTRLGGDVSKVDGRFALRLPAGPALLYFGSVPRGYTYPRPQIVRELDLHADQKPVADLRLVLELARK